MAYANFAARIPGFAKSLFAEGNLSYKPLLNQGVEVSAPCKRHLQARPDIQKNRLAQRSSIETLAEASFTLTLMAK